MFLCRSVLWRNQKFLFFSFVTLSIQPNAIPVLSLIVTVDHFPHSLFLFFPPMSHDFMHRTITNCAGKQGKFCSAPQHFCFIFDWMLCVFFQMRRALACTVFCMWSSTQPKDSRSQPVSLPEASILWKPVCVHSPVAVHVWICQRNTRSVATHGFSITAQRLQIQGGKGGGKKSLIAKNKIFFI